MITQYLDRIRKGHLVCLDEDALIRLLLIGYRLDQLREGLGRLGAHVGLNVGIVGVVAEVAAGTANANAASAYLTDVFGELVRKGTEQECRCFVHLMGDFLFALEHAENMTIDRLGGGGARAAEE